MIVMLRAITRTPYFTGVVRIVLVGGIFWRLEG